MDSELDMLLAKKVVELNLLTREQRQACVALARTGSGPPRSFMDTVLDHGYLEYEVLCRLVAIVKNRDITCEHCLEVYKAGGFTRMEDFFCKLCEVPIYLTGEKITGDGKSTIVQDRSQQIKEVLDVESGEEAPEKSLGTQIGQVRLEKFLGKGSMGRVFLGTFLKTNAKVAIKLMNADVATTDTFLKRFKREAEIASQLNHPNLVKVLDHGEDQGHHFIVMEFVDGETLEDYIEQQGNLGDLQALKVILQIAKGLNEAHIRNILHRDIKPENVFLSRGTRAKLGDFGVAKNAGKTAITLAGSLLGTPHYMSPEQAEGKQLDNRADIYSLGAMFYHTVVGRPPFEGESPVSLLYKHINQPLSFDKLARERINPAIQKIIKKMMAKEKWRRHDKTADLVQELEQILTDLEQGRTPDIVKAHSGNWQMPESVRGTGAHLFPSGRHSAVSSGGGSKWMIPLLIVLLLVIGGVAFHFWKQAQLKNGGGPVAGKKTKPLVDKKKADDKKKAKPVRDPKEPPMKIVEAIQNQIRQRDYEKALVAINLLGKQYPESEELNSMTKLIASNREKGQLYYNKSRLFYRRGSLRLAMGEIKKAFKYLPRDRQILDTAHRYHVLACKKAIDKGQMSLAHNYARQSKQYGKFYFKWFDQWMEREKQRLIQRREKMEKEYKKNIYDLMQSARRAMKNGDRSAMARVAASEKKLTSIHNRELVSLYESKYQEWDRLKLNSQLQEHMKYYRGVLQLYLSYLTKETNKTRKRIK